MPDFTVAIALLRKPIEMVYGACTSFVKGKIARLRVEGKVDALHSKLWQLQRVKTIWNPDKPLALSTIYFPVKVVINVDDTIAEREVDSLGDLQFPHCVLEGTAGQGKSILLKYLVGREIRSGERVPLLYELRGINGASLEERLSERFSDLLGEDHDATFFHEFCEIGAVSLLLDGFDEVSLDSAQMVLDGVENLSKRYPKVRIILTTRPDSLSGYRGLTQFSVVRISPLEKSRLRDFFKKITKDEAFSKTLVSALGGSPSGVQEMITTPLAATLLAIVYRARGKVPDEFAEFFEELFQVLAVRHDASKLGWRRNRSSNLTDKQLQQVFEAYCFQVRRRKVFSCTDSDAVLYAAEGLGLISMNANAEHCLQDIRRVTCLIIEEGRRYEFVHSSVASYFASKFVKSLSDSNAEKFYLHLFDANWGNWVFELDFLSKIDAVRFYEFFLIKDVEMLVAEMGDRRGVEAFARRMLESLFVLKIKGTDEGRDHYLAKSNYLTDRYSAKDFHLLAYEHVFRRYDVTARRWDMTKVVSGMHAGTSVNWSEIANSRGEVVFQGIVDELMQKFASMQKNLTAMRAAVEQNRRDSGLFTINA